LPGKKTFKIGVGPAVWQFFAGLVPIFPSGEKCMKILSVLIVAVLSTVAAAGQIKKPLAKARPTPVAAATPAPDPEPKPMQKVVVEKMNGDRLTGQFVTASTEKITIKISDAKVDVPFSEIALIRVNELPAPISAQPTPAPESTTLAIEAAIVYRSGGAQPLARADMALFDMSLTNMLIEAGVSSERNLGYPAIFGFMMQFPSQYAAQAQKALPVLQRHKVIGFSTDFQGRALVNEVKEGSYWIVCYYGTRGGFAVWDLPITIKKGANYIVLDQSNAAVSF
jgi:hypothetical protein